MVDAFAKPESGLFLGNTRWLGEYDECLAVYAPPKANEDVGDFHGKYCKLNIPVPMSVNKTLTLTMGVCLPDSCDPSFFDNFTITQNFTYPFSIIVDKVNPILNDTTLTCPKTSRKFGAGAIIVICLISIFAFLALIGSSITVFEFFMKTNTDKDSPTNDPFKLQINEEEKISHGGSDNEVLIIASMHRSSSPVWLEKVKPFFNCFCFFTNGEKILNTSSVEGQLPSLHGIRFFSMSWVILCHTYLFCMSYVRNLKEVVDVADKWTFQIILNGFFSVDSFFVLSGFLVAYIYFKESAKADGKIPWLYFYVHRFIRLTPVYMIVLAFYATLNSHLGSGPLWPEADVDANCAATWWWNLLYINNFQNMTDQCMGWTWYLANDMQFYVISPLFLITLWKWPKIGYSVVGLFLCITFTANFVITNEYSLMAGIGDIAHGQATGVEDAMFLWRDWFNKIYIKPYTRLSPYLIGIVLAYYMWKRQQNNSGRLHWVILLIGWAVASGVTLTCLFGLYHNTPSVVGAAFYNGLSRMVYACGLGWVIFVCVNGQGGAVNSFLSWKAWIPLSRLTFCAYLVHPIVQSVYYGSVRKLIEFSNLTVIMFFLGMIIISYGVAFVISLLFESPIIRLERYIRNKFAS